MFKISPTVVFTAIVCLLSFQPNSAIPCNPSEFQCSPLAAECIESNLVCDGIDDCPRGEDEANCPPAQSVCDSSEFTCDNGECIDKFWKCDGSSDCTDFSDEPASCNITCDDDEILCPHKSGQNICIYPAWLCDGDVDCIDGWDEDRTVHNCSASICNQFSCTSGECIPLSWACDGEPDCADRSDETHPNCTDVLPSCDGFFCWATSQCLEFDQVCDGKPDCPDGTDESNCTDCKFRCTSDSKCLSQDLVCDGTPDCSDGSDESDNCSACATNNGGCAAGLVCVKSPTVAQCQCQDGLLLNVDGQCTDINECSTYGKCSQTCVNTHGSYTCKCNAGYQHDPQASSLGLDCKALGPEGYVYVGYNRVVVRYGLSGQESRIVLSNLGEVMDMTVDIATSTIYWTEYLSKSLKKASLSSPSAVVDVVSSDMENPEGLSLDWIQQRLYWVDDGKGTVEVVDTDGSNRRTLRSGLDRPRDLVVDPLNGYIYVTMWGSTPGIAKLSTDGSDFTVLVGDSVGWPNGIALDLPGQRLYWVDGRHKVIESIRTDGTGRVTVKTLPQDSHPFSISVFENKVFVSDSNNRLVKVFNRFNGEDVKTFPRNTSAVTGVFVSQQALQPIVSLCKRPEGDNLNTTAFSSPTYVQGAILSVTCQAGYELSGSSVVMCREGGAWWPLPSCGLITTAEISTPSTLPKLQLDLQGNGLHGESFGIGFAVGTALLIGIVVVVAAVLVVIGKRYRLPTRPIGPINFSKPFTSKPKSEATIGLPEAMEVDEEEGIVHSTPLPH